MNSYVLTKNHAYDFYETTIDPMVEFVAYGLFKFVHVLFFWIPSYYLCLTSANQFYSKDLKTCLCEKSGFWTYGISRDLFLFKVITSLNCSCRTCTMTSSYVWLSIDCIARVGVARKYALQLINQANESRLERMFLHCVISLELVLINPTRVLWACGNSWL